MKQGMSARAERLARYARKALVFGLSVPIYAYRYMLSPMLPP